MQSPTEVFDLAGDPDEMNDLAGRPEGAERQAQLSEGLMDALVNYSDLSRPGSLIVPRAD